ncbi:hypothetical protein MUP77_19425 [Candidatus Bathyarchaeota archaeon]|nr:hypothetical protein [Candidatus Bathyarchaeota archaeon]
METSEQGTSSPELQQIKEFIEAFVEYLKGMGAFAIKIGETEQKYPQAFKMMAEMGSPENIANFISKAPPEIVAKMFEFMFRASSLTAKMQKKLNELSAGEKIQLGNEMIELAENVSELMRKAEGTSAEQTEPKEEKVEKVEEA